MASFSAASTASEPVGAFTTRFSRPGAMSASFFASKSRGMVGKPARAWASVRICATAASVTSGWLKPRTSDQACDVQSRYDFPSMSVTVQPCPLTSAGPSQPAP
jgi:hypothetical protein